MDAPSQVLTEHRLCAGVRTHTGVKCLSPAFRKLDREQKIQGEKRLRSVGATSGQVTQEVGRKEKSKSGKLCTSHN